MIIINNFKKNNYNKININLNLNLQINKIKK
jgi:hypothetical protein